MSDTKAGKILVDQGTGPACPYDRNFLSGKNLLSPVSEQANLTVVLQLRARRLPGRRVAESLGSTGNDGMVQLHLLIGGYPEVASNGSPRENESSRGWAIKDVYQCRVSPAMRFHVSVRESNPVISQMIVHSQIGESFF